MASIEILVRGPLAASFQNLLASRFTAMTITRAGTGNSTRIEGEMDQSAERALLALLWDTGHDVISMRSTPTNNDDASTESGDGDE